MHHFEHKAFLTNSSAVLPVRPVLLGDERPLAVDILPNPSLESKKGLLDEVAGRN